MNNEHSHLDRRRFVQLAGAASLAAGSGLVGRAVSSAIAAPSKTSAAEVAVAELYASLADNQKKAICFGFDDEKRSRVNANWHVTKPTIDDDLYTDAQRELIHRVVKSVTSEDGYQRLLKQTEDDDGGIGAYSIGLFGSPEGSGLHFVLTGRHLTLRADGNSVKNRAFGGAVVYGHGEGEPKENLYHYQTKKANEVFAALDGQQQKVALLEKTPRENAVSLQGDNAKLPGISVGDLSSDQMELVEQVLKVIFAPYRKEDVDEVFATVKETGGLKKLNMAFYKQGDLENDQVWDNWRVEGPGLVCHFRGAPHVHAYINVGKKS